jgi:FSR family fosmidomycin resistance protein-like MFS transporter
LRQLSLLLTLGHMVNDTYSNLLSGLLPILMVSFNLSYLFAGLAAMIFNVTSSLTQPVLGRWFDRTQKTWLLEGGLALNCIGTSLLGLSPSFVILLFLLGTAGLGAAAFHPPAFSTVARSSRESRGESMGVFISGGNAGVFLGPILAGGVVTTMGLKGTLALLPIGLVASLMLLKVHVIQDRPRVIERSDRPADKPLIGLLMAITALRSTTVRAAITFLPLYLVARGESLLLATAVASIWVGVGVVGQVAGGRISDRVGRRPVIVTSLLIGASLFYGFLMTSGMLSMLLLAVSGGVLYGSWSVIVATASEAAPNSVGAVAGLMLGFSIGIGGLAALGFGSAADLMGLQSAFYLFAAFALVGGILGLAVPKRLESAAALP